MIRSDETSLRLHVLPELGRGGEVDPALEGKGLVDGKPAVCVCERFNSRAP